MLLEKYGSTFVEPLDFLWILWYTVARKSKGDYGMNFEKPVEFDISKAVRFDDLAIGQLFIAIDGICDGKRYSERVYCKTVTFGSEYLGNIKNAVGVTESYRAYMDALTKVVPIKVVDWRVADYGEAL